VVCLALRAVRDPQGRTDGTLVMEGHGSAGWRVVASTARELSVSTVDVGVRMAEMTFAGTLLAGGRCRHVTLLTYVEDRGRRAPPADRIWLGVYDSRARLLTAYSSTGPAPAGATVISQGGFSVAVD
jgi:hypothetical protein